MKRNISKIIPICCVVVVIMLNVGCANVYGNYSMISTKDIDIDSYSNYNVMEESVFAEGTRIAFVPIMPLPKKKSDIPVDKVNNNALTKREGTVALKDVKFNYSSFHFPILFSIYKYRVEGKPIIPQENLGR